MYHFLKLLNTIDIILTFKTHDMEVNLMLKVEDGGTCLLNSGVGLSVFRLASLLSMGEIQCYLQLS